MRYLLIAPQLGFTHNGDIIAGGLLSFGRTVARALGSSPDIDQLSVWCLLDPPGTEALIEKMVRVHAHPNLNLTARCFNGSKTNMGLALARASHDHIMYLLVNQAVLSLIPWHAPYTVWEIGFEMFQPISFLQRRALNSATRLLSISHNTNETAIQNNPGLRSAKVVHLCVEPPLFDKISNDSLATYNPAQRAPAIFIMANMLREYLYKGHQELIAGWPEVLNTCPDAELWIGGSGSGRALLEKQARALPGNAPNQIKFLGYLTDNEVHHCFQTCRAFAMPSRGEGFGLVFVEAARYGLPCIGGKHDSVKEVVLHNETGLLVEQNPHDVAAACVHVLTDDTLAHRLGESGRQRYLNYFQFKHFRARLLKTLQLRSG